MRLQEKQSSTEKSAESLSPTLLSLISEAVAMALLEEQAEQEISSAHQGRKDDTRRQEGGSGVFLLAPDDAQKGN